MMRASGSTKESEPDEIIFGMTPTFVSILTFLICYRKLIGPQEVHKQMRSPQKRSPQKRSREEAEEEEEANKEPEDRTRKYIAADSY